MKGPYNVNAVSGRIAEDGKYLLTIGSGDSRTCQFLFGDAMIDLVFEEIARFKLAKMQEPMA